MTCLDESQKCDARLPRPIEVEFICRSDTYWAHLSSSRYFQRHTRFNSNANCGQSLCRQLIRRGAGAVTNGSLAGHDPRRLTRVSDPGCNARVCILVSGGEICSRCVCHYLTGQGAFRPAGLACPSGCSLPYFQPRRVRSGQFPGVPFESIKVAVVRPRRFYRRWIDLWARFSRLPGNATTVAYQRCEMKNPTFAAELRERLGAPSNETVESLRLLKAFNKLAPAQRFEVIDLVERLASDALAAPDRPLS
jgi:hypothetical protein